ncbi:DNA internalization-related competence protein ComEC/Rec2 [Pantoea cypripedii]|uniref:DNA internalization-related competence protein ComEC/Rec2 n=1 Tax=Pantoea cypripedii TaxID=55209 RepID=A0A1X1ETD0_PANCY|nr:DNA internalization-related competence protein ComEC/Rec2 [Pantoea cypripedii]MBP2197109.1 competence protein ComEC [Pantoea cypripedii]ORM93045.1 DNA internalization-related competence protein ComEC/Rec2 [Pantoea cypripedii]
MPTTWIVLAGLMIPAALPLVFLPQLPGNGILAAIAVAALLLRLQPFTSLRIAAPFLLLMLWALSEARQMTASIDLLTRAPVSATVRVTDVREDNKQLKIQLLQIDGRYQFPPLFATLNDNGEEEPFCAGQRWQMQLRLRPVHARLNEGEFDLQRFAVAQHTPLQGSIIRRQEVNKTCSWRSRLIQYHLPAFAQMESPAIVQALAFGIRDAMTEEQRRLLRETGTAHLMAISGMHIALAASVGWILARMLQFFFPARRINYLFPLIASGLTAAIYCWVSGSHPPAQRAMLALTLWILLRIAGWQLSGWQVWTLCVGLLLFVDPLTVLSESFWLSALAVAVLLIWYHWFALPVGLRTRRRWIVLQLLHLQLGMMLLMAPLQIFLFQGISLSALLANLLAVPVISFISVPLILLAMLIPVTSLSGGLWWLADQSVHKVMQGLAWLPPGWLAWGEALPAMGVLWGGIVAWRSGILYRAPVQCCSIAVALLIWRSNSPRDEWQIDMIDVGHGLAVVITQGDEAVLYDTGPRWNQGDAGNRVILPWLQRKNITLRAVVLSHKHLDHRGGLDSIVAAKPETPVRSALPETHHLPCYQGEVWHWGKLRFNVLWPPRGAIRGENNDSCVVRVDDGKVSLLLTGDIELEAERQLVAQQKQALASTILQVPHHGSRTSSSALLLRNVAGRVAIASVARYNAWRMPAKTVVDAYRQNGYLWYDTAQSGQINIAINAGDWQIKGLREQIMPRWYHQWFGVKRESR